MASIETSPVSTDVDPLLRQRQLAGIQEAIDYNNPDALAQALSIQAVDLSSGVVAESLDSADEYLREQTTQRGMGGLLKRIWHGNIARDYLRQREVRRGQNEIVGSNNLYVRHGSTATDHQQAAEAVVSRFTAEFIHEGESNQDAETLTGGDVFRSEIDQLVRDYARGDLTDASLEIEKNRIVSNFGSQRHDFDRNKGLLWADNILAVARNARGAFEHSVSLDDIQKALSVNVGEARMGVRTEASKELVDRAIDKLYGTRVGSLVNETTLSLGVAITLATTKRTVTSAASAAMRTLGLGVGAGVIAGVREVHHVSQERRLHSRQMAEGGEVNIESRRREQMEGTRYETVPANELVERLQTTQEQHVASPNADTARALLGTLIEARTRVSMSDEPRSRRFGADELGRDLISYSSKEQVEQERMNLDVAISSARVELQRILDDSDDATLQNITGNTDRSLPDILDRGAVIYRSVFEWDLSRKDEAFRRLQMSRAAKAAVVGAAVGGVMGFASQELRAVFDGGMQGLGEQFQQGQDRLTELAALVHGTHHAVQGKVPNLDFAHSGFRVGNNALDLPPGYHVVHEGKGYELIGPDKHAIGPIAFNSKGGLDSATQAMLEKHGFKLDTTTEAFSTVQTETTTTDMSFDQYMKAHPNRFAPIHRQFWYENGTYDHNGSTIHSEMNEQLLLWGGENGTGVDSQGNYVFDVSHMMANGSFHVEHTAQGTEFIRANAPELLKDHKLYIAISATKGTQFNVIYVPINEHGQAVFDPHDPLFKSLFSTENGHAHFNGAYAEVVQDMGKTSDGGMSVRMLATVVGSNHPNAIQETIQTTVRGMGEHVVTHLGAPAEAGLPVEIAPVIPIRSRRGMEALVKESTLGNPNIVRMYYSGKSLQELRHWLAEDATRLHSRRMVIQEDGRTEWVEADGSTVKRDVQRERTTIATYLEKEHKNNPDHYRFVERVADAMEPMSDANRVSINVPAWMEGESLYHFLDEYLRQTDASGKELDPNTYEVNILVNRRVGTKPDNSVEVLERFVRDFESSHGFKPRVNFFDIELEPSYANVGYARKLLTDVVMLRDMRRVGQVEPLYIETEDADMVHIDPHTVYNLVRKLDSQPQLDAVRGIQDRAPEYMKDNDMLFLRRRAWDFFELHARAKKFRDPTHPNWNFTWNRVVTGGWNTGYTAEAYALIGGYDVVEAGEDMSVGEKITMVRGDGQLPNLEVVGQVYSRSDSSPRRFIHEIRSKQAAYDDFANEGINSEIRGSSIKTALDSIRQYARITDTNVAEFNAYIKSIAGWAREATPGPDEAERMTRRLLFWLGFKKDDYELTDSGVEVKNWDNVKDALSRYRRRYVPRTATRT